MVLLRDGQVNAQTKCVYSDSYFTHKEEEENEGKTLFFFKFMRKHFHLHNLYYFINM